MKEATVTGKKFVRPADFSVSKHLGDSFVVFKDDGKPQEIRIRFDSFASRLVRERKWHVSQKIKELANGEIELTLKLGNLTEVQRWILSWGEHAQVIAPAKLQQSVHDAAAIIVSRYAKGTKP
jgi:proteasome accessory factor B